MFDLKGKVALVTGAASGIGFACAKELLRNGLKAVALVDVNAENGQKALSEITKEFGTNSAIFVKADVSDKIQFEGAFEKTVQTFKQLDIVLNNAGIIQEIQWEKCIGVNFIGVVNGTMLAVEKYFPKYKSGPEAVIVNTASVAGLNAYEPVPMYSSTKSAVIAFSQTIGGEIHHQRTGVRILAMCPGIVETTITNITPQEIEEPYLSAMLKGCRSAPGRQKPEEIAQKFMKIIKEAPTGTVWFAVGENCTKVEFPKLYN